MKGGVLAGAGAIAAKGMASPLDMMTSLDTLTEEPSMPYGGSNYTKGLEVQKPIPKKKGVEKGEAKGAVGVSGALSMVDAKVRAQVRAMVLKDRDRWELLAKQTGNNKQLAQMMELEFLEGVQDPDLAPVERQGVTSASGWQDVTSANAWQDVTSASGWHDVANRKRFDDLSK